MSNKTIVILFESQGEYDSYQESPSACYIINKKNFDIEEEYSNYFFGILKTSTTIPVEKKSYRDNYNNIQKEAWGYPMKMTKLEKKELKEIEKKHTIKYFVEEILQLKKINFTTYLS